MDRARSPASQSLCYSGWGQLASEQIRKCVYRDKLPDTKGRSDPQLPLGENDEAKKERHNFQDIKGRLGGDLPLVDRLK